MPQLTPSEIILLRSMGEVIPDDGYLPSSSSEEVYDDEEVNITQRDLRNGNVVRTFRANGETMLRLLESEMQSSDTCSKQNVKDLLYEIADTAVDIAERAETLAVAGGSEPLDADLQQLIEKIIKKISVKGNITDEQFEELLRENFSKDAEPAKEPDGGKRRRRRTRKTNKKK
jgi:hypothetical protein